MLKGIDVSHWQGEVSWKKVRVDFAYLKATEGEKYIDPMLTTNWKGAQGQNIPVGIYHFFDPAQDAGLQAEHFCKVFDSLKGKRLIPVLDVEKTGNVSKDLFRVKVQKWLDIVEKHIGQKPIIYTGSSFARRMRMAKTFKDYALWIAHYRVKTPNIAGWSSWLIWQYNDRGKVPGIRGYVDVNYLAGELPVCQ